MAFEDFTLKIENENNGFHAYLEELSSSLAFHANGNSEKEAERELRKKYNSLCRILDSIILR